ncbi:MULTISPECIES: Zn-dependent hydrolase [unclassified Chelatococcus]|uniref:Zn-dependent hydrolase n=1 Tax=unclassified Chelatococcus TaxID=2638111 RepID=UPI001BCC7168|nr:MULTISPECIES: Zn-dependent hydrolase [unclassified Chelatococcus]MBS7699866.1 hydantoinase/carbamoylase family amidase [Chelatococcus sp. YT9]MBX3558788.1 hydantoinase/carbamoylase family amidase [Chelatococcus sp.]
MSAKLSNGPVAEPDMDLATRLFDTLRDKTRDGRGVTRAAYGDGEQLAHDLVAAEARRMGLDVAVDATGNLYVTMRGTDPDGKAVIIGSHLDSVPIGGNFDGAAGVFAGLAILSGWHAAGFRPRRDVMVMAIRAEESNWFPYSYVGSKGALGLLPAEALEVKRSDTGRSLREHMIELGLDPASVAAGIPHLKPEAVAAYLELHIEQGPVLIGADQPVTLVTGIRGSFRYRQARMIGEYAHSGAVPRSYRHDAVIAAADFVTRLQEEWIAMESEGHDMTLTVGIFSTDPAQHAFSKIAGEVSLAIDVRSHVTDTLDEMRRRLHIHADAVSRKHGVTIDLGPLTGSAAAVMDAGVLKVFGGAMRDLGLPHFEMASGAGHDAAVFANAGIPTIMLFVRNQNGSHNPDEAMEMDDFAIATRLLATGVERLL